LIEARQAWLGGLLATGGNGLWTTVSMGRRSQLRCLARMRCMRVVNAWAAKGDFTVPIDALGLPKESLIDPYDLKTLRVKATPKGPIVYSVGDDLTDDGGKIEGQPETDVGYGPSIYEAPQ
jgi:hypothetical protein